MLSTKAKEFLSKRGISEGVALVAGVESASGRTGEELVFPYLHGGKRVNAKYRGLAEKRFRQDEGGEKVVWRIDQIAEHPAEPLIITEGEMDALAAMEAGYSRVVSVPDGAPNAEQGPNYTGRKYDYLPSLIDAARDCNEIILAFDGDRNGRNLLNDLSARLGRPRIKYVGDYPQGCKDLNDALMKFGAKGVTQTLQRARWWRVDGVAALSELPPAPDLEIWKPQITRALDEHVSLCPGHFSVWTGLPGSGKSALLRAISINLATKQMIPACVASFEDDIRGDFLPDVAKYLSGRARDQLTADDYARAETLLENRYRFIVPNWDAEPSVGWLIERMETAARRYGSRLFVVDPWTELEHDFGDQSETQYTRRAIGDFRRFARRFDVHVAMVCHPAKPKDADAVPGGYSISGSAHWVNKAELGVTVHRDLEEGCALVRVWKSKRHDLMGPPGDVKLEFDPATGRYVDWYGKVGDAA